ncbi:MAG: class I SAM-dependent methyltransferase [bacterium]|nr:class I SAM-dependent methyltransferase [bacterium]
MPQLTFPIAPSDIETLERCPVCKETGRIEDVTEVMTEEKTVFLTTAVCHACRMIFRRRRPRLDWFERMWSLRSAVQKQKGHVPFNSEIEKERHARYARTATLLKQYGSGSKVIDIGCGPATGLRAFSEAGFTATGLEPDQSRARFVNVPEVEIIEMTIEQYAPMAEASFDSATCQHSLEHFHQPREVLSLIASLIRPGGLIYIEVPDWRQHVKDWNDALYLAHMNNFVEESLISLGQRVGLQLAGQIFPKGGSEGETHLGCIFRKTTGMRTEKHKPASAAFLEQVRSVYRRKLNDSPPAGVVRFVVPYINDISLTYKIDPTVIRMTIRENLADRRANFVRKANLYRVCYA